MNPYATMTRARIQPCDMARATLTDPSIAAISLATQERQRGYQAEAELAWLLKQHGMPPASVSSRVSMLRQTIGEGLVRAGQRLSATPLRGAAPATALADGTLTPVG